MELNLYIRPKCGNIYGNFKSKVNKLPRRPRWTSTFEFPLTLSFSFWLLHFKSQARNLRQKPIRISYLSALRSGRKGKSASCYAKVEFSRGVLESLRHLINRKNPRHLLSLCSKDRSIQPCVSLAKHQQGRAANG